MLFLYDRHRVQKATSLASLAISALFAHQLKRSDPSEGCIPWTLWKIVQPQAFALLYLYGTTVYHNSEELVVQPRIDMVLGEL